MAALWLYRCYHLNRLIKINRIIKITRPGWLDKAYGACESKGMSAEIPSQTQTILWDLDGTLLDSFAVYREALAEILPGYGRSVPPVEALLSNFHGKLEDSLKGVVGGVEPDELQKIIGSFLEVQNRQYQLIEHHLCPDAMDLARRAHRLDLQQIIVTNRDHAGRQLASPRSIVERSELQKYISHIVCGDDGQYRKPNPAVLHKLADELDPSRTIVVGDQHVDAEFALNLGATAIIVTRNGKTAALDEYVGNDQVRVVSSLTDVCFSQSR